MTTWKTRGWRKVKGGRLANADIWSQFDEVLLMHGNVAWHWVPRRSDAMSKRVDRIAVAVRKSVQSSQARTTFAVAKITQPSYTALVTVGADAFTQTVSGSGKTLPRAIAVCAKCLKAEAI